MKFPPSSVALGAYETILAMTIASMGVASLLSQSFTTRDLWPVVGLAVVAALGERARVRLGPRLEASISLIPTVFAAAVLGPLAAMVVGGGSFLGEFPVLLRGEHGIPLPYRRWRVYTAMRVISGGAAGFAALGVASLFASGIPRVLVSTLTAAIAAEALDVLLTTVTASLRGLDSVEILRALGAMAVASVPLYVPLVGMLSLAYRELSPWTLAFFFIPALAAQRTFALYQQQRELSDGLAVLNTTLAQANLSFASALVSTLDARDRYTAGHSAAVAIYARDIATHMGLSEREQQLAHLCGLVHDIGKIGLPAGLLEKPGALTLDERREMQRHSTIGERILANVETYAEIADVVRHHHERMDGNGYPDGISSYDIPLLARIIAVADAYNAMTSDRPYRDAMPTRVARVRLAQAAESQFDTSVVSAFEAVLANASDDYRRAAGDEFLWLRRQSKDDNPEGRSLSGPVRWYATTA